MIKIYNNNFFKINKNNNIYIYGGGIVGTNLARELFCQNYHVSRIIDINCSSVACSYADIISYEKALNEIDCEDDPVVIITLNDGQKHDDIAYEFFLRGVKKIVFLPTKLHFSQVIEKEYRFSFYELVVHHNFDVSIPFFCKKNDYKYRVIDDRYTNHISLWFPISKLNYSTSKEKNMSSCKSVGKVLECTVYRNLFSYLAGNVMADTKEYMLFQGVYEPDAQAILLKNREELYRLYKRQIRYNFDFFTASPAIVELIDGKLWVKDGNHRIHFLYQQGFEKVPIIVRKEDFYNLQSLCEDVE